MDGEISQGRKIAFRRLFQDRDLLDEVEEGFVEFFTATGRFGDYYMVGDMGVNQPYNCGKHMGKHALFYRSYP